MAAAEIPERSRRSRTSLRLALAALFLVAAGSGATEGLRSQGDLAYAIGGSLGVSLLWFLVLWLGILRGRIRRPFVAALSIVAVTLIAGFIGSVIAKERDQGLARSLNSAFRSYTQGQPVNPHPQTSGSQGKAEALLRTLLSEQAADAQGFRTEVDQLHVEDAFGAALSNDPTAARAYEAATQGEQLVAKYRRRYEAGIANFRVRLAASDVTPDVKEDMERGFDSGVSSGRPSAEQGFDLHARYMTEFAAAAKVLQAAAGKWRIAGGNIQFDDPAAQNDYVAHIQAVQRLAGEIDAYSANARASNTAAVDRLEKQ